MGSRSYISVNRLGLKQRQLTLLIYVVGNAAPRCLERSPASAKCCIIRTTAVYWDCVLRTSRPTLRNLVLTSFRHILVPAKMKLRAQFAETFSSAAFSEEALSNGVIWAASQGLPVGLGCHGRGLHVEARDGACIRWPNGVIISLFIHKCTTLTGWLEALATWLLPTAASGGPGERGGSSLLDKATRTSNTCHWQGVPFE